MMLDNYFYGHKFILENYSKIKKKKIIFALIQHGWLSSSSAIITNLGKRLFNIYPYICWNSKLKKLLERKSIKNVHAIGAPFLYLVDQKKNIKYKEKGTIVFPSKCHFADNNNFRVNHKELINLVEKKYKGPYTVSLFYTELNSEISKFYKKKKWKIVCAGSRLNSFFLYRILRQLKKNKNVVFTSIVSPLFYSFYLKKKTFLLINYKIKNKVFPIKNKTYDTEAKDEIFYKKKYPFIFQNNQIEKKFNLSLLELGYKDMKTKKELSKLLFSNNLIQKICAKIFYIKDKFIHRNFLNKELR